MAENAAVDEEPEMPCCDYRDHSGNHPACACPQHERSPLHPFGSDENAEPWVPEVCPSCGGCGGRFDATFVEGGCTRCQGHGILNWAEEPS